jgi:hypothetical protein
MSNTVINVIRHCQWKQGLGASVKKFACSVNSFYGFVCAQAESIGINKTNLFISADLNFLTAV